MVLLRYDEQQRTLRYLSSRIYDESRPVTLTALHMTEDACEVRTHFERVVAVPPEVVEPTANDPAVSDSSEDWLQQMFQRSKDECKPSNETLDHDAWLDKM